MYNRIKKHEQLFSDDSHFAKLEKKTIFTYYLPQIHTAATQRKLCMIFLMYVATLQHLNLTDTGQEPKSTIHSYIVNRHVPLKQG